MKYFVVSDVHGFASELFDALSNAGFDPNNDNHMLISLGDIFDRGNQPYEVYQYLRDLKNMNKAILVKGNHEELMLELLEREDIIRRDIHNETAKTLFLLSFALDTSLDYKTTCKDCCKIIKASPIPKFLDDMVNYYETEEYIFVHGYLPLNDEKTAILENIDEGNWHEARWLHGFELSLNGINYKKKVVCGHVGSERYRRALGIEINNPYSIIQNKHCISIDATTKLSGKVNVLVIDEGDISND